MSEAPYCNITSHVTGDLYAKNLKDHKAKIIRLEATVAALEAELGRRPRQIAMTSRVSGREIDHAELLVNIADAILTGEEFAQPAPGAQVTDHTKTGRQKPHSTEPKGGDRAARGALRELISKGVKMLDVFESRQLNDWLPVQIDFDPGPKDRCWTRGCSHYSRTFEDSCPGCGKAATETVAIRNDEDRRETA